MKAEEERGSGLDNQQIKSNWCFWFCNLTEDFIEMWSGSRNRFSMVAEFGVKCER